MPITAWTSITHRASGIFLFAGVAVLIYLLDLSLSSPEDFALAKQSLQTPLAKFVIWAVLAGLAYHSCAGVRHLIMDMGIGESMEGGVLGARLAIASSVILAILAGVWVW